MLTQQATQLTLTLADLTVPHRWNQGPPFLYLPPDQWPANPSAPPSDAADELRKSMFCGTARVRPTKVPADIRHFKCSEDLVVGTSQHISSLAAGHQPPERPEVETILL